MRRASAARPAPRRVHGFPLPLETEPTEARLVDALPSGSGWQFEPKWDGFRCLAFRGGDDVELRAKSGKSLTRYFPEIVASLAALDPRQFVLDGELVIPIGNTLAFDALQNRLHPAESRIRKLARETPALLILFDCLASADGESLLAQPLLERRHHLEVFFASLRGAHRMKLTDFTRDRRLALRWFGQARGALDGIVAKRLDEAYHCGERAMLKAKQRRTADCVVGGFRYASDSREVGSLLLGLYNDAGALDHVGFTSAIADADRAALTKRLEKLRGEPGFTGAAPGASSRWSTERSAAWEPLEPKLVVEVQYDQVTGNRFRHGTRLLRWRPDKSPAQCRMDQMAREARPSRLMAAIIRAPAA